MASHSDFDMEEKAVTGALEKLQQRAPDEFKKLAADPKKKEEITTAARRAAKEVLKLSKGLRADQPLSDIESHLGKYLSHDRVQMIKNGLSIPIPTRCD